MNPWIALWIGTLVGLLPWATVALLLFVYKVLGLHVCPGHDKPHPK
jgi:hypothetical protein